MVGHLQPLDEKFPIVGPDGKPTLYFIRWAQQKQIDIGESVDEGRALEIVKTFLTEHPLQAGSGIDLTPDGDLNNSPTISANAQEILDQLSSTRGAVLFRGVSGWEALLPGTPGYVLSTNGPGEDPTWVEMAGGGGGGSNPDDAIAWRLSLAPTKSNWGGTYIGMAELQYKDSLGDILSVGGAASSSRDINYLWTAARAFDGITDQPDNGWLPTDFSSADITDWLTYTKATAWRPSQLTIFPPVNHTNSFIESFTLQFSVDGLSWTDHVVIDTATPVATVGQTYSIP